MAAADGPSPRSMSMQPIGIVVIPTPAAPHAPCSAVAERVANRSIVSHVVDGLANAVREVAIVGPHETIATVRCHLEDDLGAEVGVSYLPQAGRTDLLGALRAAAGFVGDAPAIVHLADGLLGQDVETITRPLAAELPDLLLMLHRSDDARDGLGRATQRLLGVSELDGSRSRLALTGVCLFGPGALREIATAANVSAEQGLLDVAERMAGDGRTVEAALARGWRRYRGEPEDLLELNRVVLDRQLPAGEPLDKGDNRIEGRVVIDPTAEIVSSTILGPCIIGPEARITSSYVGPYTSIGAGAEIEGAEVEGSIVAEGVRISYTGRIEGSTIGRQASIFRDFRLPRAMRLHVGEGVEVALE